MASMTMRLPAPSHLCKAHESSSSFFFGCNLPVANLSRSQALRSYAPLEIVASKKLQGTVTKTVNDKTAAVEVVRIAPHPRYKKRVKSTKRYQVHDPENACQVGDVVTLVKCTPVSKTKTFVVGEIRRKKDQLSSVRDDESELPPFESEVAAASG